MMYYYLIQAIQQTLVLYISITNEVIYLALLKNK